MYSVSQYILASVDYDTTDEQGEQLFTLLHFLVDNWYIYSQRLCAVVDNGISTANYMWERYEVHEVYLFLEVEEQKHWSCSLQQLIYAPLCSMSSPQSAYC